MNVCVVQARMGSSRFPGKSMELLDGRPLVYWSLRNALRIPRVDGVFLATTSLPEDDVLESFAVESGIEVYRGEVSNVFSRFLEVARLTGAKNMIRLTADNPLTPLDLALESLSAHLDGPADYTSTSLSRSFPRGTDIECFTKSALERLANEKLSAQELEHVTLGFKTRPDKFHLLSPIKGESSQGIALTVDTPADLRKMEALFRGAPDGWDVNLAGILRRVDEVGITSDN